MCSGDKETFLDDKRDAVKSVYVGGVGKKGLKPQPVGIVRKKVGSGACGNIFSPFPSRYVFRVQTYAHHNLKMKILVRGALTSGSEQDSPDSVSGIVRVLRSESTRKRGSMSERSRRMSCSPKYQDRP